MDEAELCDRIALITGGKILQIDTPKAIMQAFPKNIYKVRTSETYRLIQDLKTYPRTHSAYPFGEYLHFTSSDSNFKKEELFRFLEEKQHNQIEVEKIDASIEDTFMELSKT